MREQAGALASGLPQDVLAPRERMDACAETAPRTLVLACAATAMLAVVVARPAKLPVTVRSLVCDDSFGKLIAADGSTLVAVDVRYREGRRGRNTRLQQWQRIAQLDGDTVTEIAPIRFDGNGPITKLAVAGDTIVLEHLDDIYRRVGLFVTAQVSMTKPGSEGLAEIRAAMARFRANPPPDIAGYAVEQVVDLDRSEGGLPRADVLVFRLVGGRRVIMHPSGTEPKLKSYDEVRVEVGADEAMETARQRGLADLAGLRDAHQKMI
jgi:hypothetical protein